MNYKKIVTTVFTILSLTTLATNTTHASYTGVSFTSQKPSSIKLTGKYDKNQKANPKVVATLKKVLTRYNSPLAVHAQAFADSAMKNGLDPFMVASIAGVESGFGKRYIPGTNNAWGWGGGKIAFKSWDEAISTISSKLSTKYVARGATTLVSINKAYCPPNPLWHEKVEFFRSKFYAEMRKG